MLMLILNILFLVFIFAFILYFGIKLGTKFRAWIEYKTDREYDKISDRYIKKKDKNNTPKD